MSDPVCHRCGKERPFAATGEIVIDGTLFVTVGYMDICQDCADVIEEMLRNFLEATRAVSS